MVAKSSFFLLVVPGLSMHLVERGSSAAIQSDLKAADTDCRSCVQAVNAFDGSLTSAVTVNNALQSLDNDFKNCAKDVQSAASLSAADCQAIIDYINNPLEPDFRACLNALQSKKAAFTSSGSSGTICNDFKSYKSDGDACIRALLLVCPSAQKSSVTAAGNRIDNDISTAQTYYGC